MKTMEKLISIIETIKKGNTNTLIIDKKTNLISDLGFDSLDIIELIVEIENEFHIEIDDNDLDVSKITIVGELVLLIENNNSILADKKMNDDCSNSYM